MSEYPSDWSVCSLGEVAERIRRTNDDQNLDVLTISSTEGWVDQKRKWARDMAGKSIEKYTLLERGEFSYNRGNSKTYPQGCIFRLESWDRALVPNVYHSFRIISPDIDGTFVQHFFAAGGLNEQLRSVITSSVRDNGLLNITADTFFASDLPIPPLPEQKKIAEILSGIDMAIKTMHSAIIKIDNAIQGARDQTQACEGNHVRIGELIAKISTGVSVNGENRPCKASEHGVLKVSCVSKGVFYPSENKVIQGEHKDRATISVKKGMLLMSRANTPDLVGACGLATDDHDNLFLPDKIWSLELSQYAPCSKRWLNNALNSCISRSRIRDASTGTSDSMRNISQSNFCEIELLIPTSEIQQAQADVIESLQKKRTAFTGKLSKYLMIKSALSDDLLSGRKRVTL